MAFLFAGIGPFLHNGAADTLALHQAGVLAWKLGTREFRQTQAGDAPWKTGHCLLVAVGPGPFSEPLIRWTRRMADGLRCPWLAVHVEGSRSLPESAQAQLENNLAAARELGAGVFTTTDDDTD